MMRSRSNCPGNSTLMWTSNRRQIASPALSDGQMFLRGFKNLYCIGKKETK